MRILWQRFVSFFGDPEGAAWALLCAGITVLVAFAFLAHLVLSSRPLPALGVALMLGVVLTVCIRDFRRGRWSALSGVLMTLWILLIGFAIGWGFWISIKSE